MINPKQNILEKKIHLFAEQNMHKVAIQGDDNQLNYQQLLEEIESLSSVLQLSDKKYQSYGIIMDNHPAWAVLDLALMFQQQCSVPLPPFFSVEQIIHALLDTGVDHLIIEIQNKNLAQNDIYEQDLNLFIAEYFEPGSRIIIADKYFLWHQAKSKCSVNQQQENRIQKITYTSGTTAKPKGVMLTEEVILAKVAVLAEASEANENDIALSILPLSTLLENIAGLYVPLFCGAQITLLSPETIGIQGSSQIDAAQLMTTLQKYQPTVFIIIPQLLLLFIKMLQSGYQLPASIRFIAMGGAPVSMVLLLLAEQLKIPVFEGYGLSEASSVVAVNTPSQYRRGSVGKVLNTHQIKICDDGEILVKGQFYKGYLNQGEINPEEFYATGDIGKIDKDGFIFITGRKKNIINTSYGRNISPEWIEKELEAIPVIAQALVYGHGKPFLIALLVLRDMPDMSTELLFDQLNKALESLNSNLPDYARIADFIEIEEAFSVQNKQLTGTGRPRRNIIYDNYKNNLDFYYSQHKESQYGERV